MEQRINVVTLGVADLERSHRFYENWLGFLRGTFREDIVFFRLNGVVLAPFQRDHLAADAQVPSEESGFRGVTSAHCTRSPEEVDAVLAHAVRAGGKILKPALDVFWGICPTPDCLPLAI